MQGIKGKFLFLGTGGSVGIPVIGCKCPVCSSMNPKNKRMRPSALLIIGKKKILIDTGPDLRQQALLFDISEIDGVIITHTHYDHIGGLDELRVFYFREKKKVPILLSQSSFADIKQRLPYLFQEKKAGISLAAQLDFQILEDKRGETSFLDIPFRYMTYEQGGMEVTGFRFGNCAYISDIREYPQTIFGDLKQLDTLILSALRFSPSPMHFTIEEGIAFAQKVGAKKTYFMHLTHDIEHEKISTSLPEKIFLAYDGLSFDL
jgi:phosphoribosyl 1,2-cyclic phosphate phosphodiesterase